MKTLKKLKKNEHPANNPLKVNHNQIKKEKIELMIKYFLIANMETSNIKKSDIYLF